jgi:hypothetical protein
METWWAQFDMLVERQIQVVQKAHSKPASVQQAASNSTRKIVLNYSSNSQISDKRGSLGKYKYVPNTFNSASRVDT